MPSVRTVATSPLDADADLLVVPVFKGGIEGPGVVDVLRALGLERVPVTPGFRGDVGQHLLLGAPGLRVGAVLLVGLGRMDAVDAEQLRRAAGVAATEARRAPGCRTVATTLAQLHPAGASVAAIAEGFVLGAHTERRFKGTPAPELERLDVLVPSSVLAMAGAAAEQGCRAAAAAVDARELVDLPPDRKRPPELAAAIAELAGGDCEVAIRDEHWLAEAGCGGILGVGRASSSPPRLVELSYRPEEPLGTVVLAGKGITFDTGGLSIKTSEEMATMKADMAGAAAVAAACKAVAAAGVRLEVIGLLGLAENHLGADAQRPSDVITTAGGTTVEVLDTDAEGRLVLADLLALGARREPDAIVDVATLTGAAVTAVGAYAGALMSDDDALADALLRAASAAGEDLWRLPLWGDLDRFLDGSVADVVNVTDAPGAGAITAGLFLRRFVGDVPWAHLDIAGPAFVSKELARGHLSAGSTGFGTRTLLNWLRGSS